MPRGLGTVQKRVLLLLMGGLVLGLTRSPGRYFKILKDIQREWRAIDRDALKKAIRSLYESRMISARDNPDGSVTIVLSRQGRASTRALTFNPDTLRIPVPAQWDGKWRIILFDIPHRMKKARDAFRFHLRRLGLYPLQKSVFVYPYECRDEIDFLIEFHHVRPYVRSIVAGEIDTELHLKQIFRQVLHAGEG